MNILAHQLLNTSRAVAETPITPHAPTNLVINNETKEASFTLSPAFSISQHQYTKTGINGTILTVPSNPIVVGSNETISAGNFAVRVAAQGINPASAWLVSIDAFTASSSSRPLWLLLGQSNTGYPSISGLDGFDPLSSQNATRYAVTHNAQIMYLRTGTSMNDWVTMHTGVNTANNDGSGDAINLLSAGIREYNALYPSIEPYVFHMGKGGIPLADPTVQASWHPFPIFNGVTGYYDEEYRKYIYNACAKAVSRGLTLDFKFELWMQGETDTLTQYPAEHYLAALTQHFINTTNYWQAAFTAYGMGTVPNFKKIIVKIRPYGQYTDAVNTAQATYCANPANNAVLINVDDVTPQLLHFMPDGDVIVGLRAFDQFKDL